MGNNNLNASNDILIKVDHNNLIYIDPNTVLENGVPAPRAVQPENLSMYVNLEADLVPRTTLIANENKSKISSIASGTLNFMNNQDGSDYDTRWTNVYTDRKLNTTGTQTMGLGKWTATIPIINGVIENDTTAQSFGIDSIAIKVAGANFIPRVDIRFIDVRGKTLFESPANSPYAAFFHIPWPIFYLTVKGYYGKAIKYRLHMIKFNSKYNPSNGNFEIDCNFVGSTYAYLADIGITSILNAPYFYFSELDEQGKFNPNTGYYDKKLSKSTKGYRVLKSVYQDYISKGYLPKDFPIRTLREIIVIAGRLNKILENTLFKEIISHHTLAAVKEYENNILDLRSMIKTWGDRYVTLSNYFLRPGYPKRKDPFSSKEEEVRWYYWTVKDTSNKDPLEILQNNLTNAVTKLENNEAFGQKNSVKSTDDKKLTTKTISCETIKKLSDYYIQQDGKTGIDYFGLWDQIDLIYVNFEEQRNNLEIEVENIMNKMISEDKTLGIGFKPSVRNIIAILLANAETYIKLMRDVHEKAFEKAKERKKIFDEESSKTTSGVISDGGNTIYPWPEIKLASSGGKELVLVYPGSKEMEKRLRSNDPNLWPEVDFVENFYQIATKIKDNIVGKEGTTEHINYIFDDSDTTFNKDISVFTNIMDNIPYTDKAISSIFYEIYERAKTTTSLTPFDSNAIRELANIEFLNLKNQIQEDIDVIETLKRNITSYNSLISQLESNITKYQYYVDQLPTTQYIIDAIDNDFSISKFTMDTNTTSNDSEYTKVNSFLNNYKAEDYRHKLYPFNSSTYQSYNTNDLHLYGTLQVNTPTAFISSPINGNMWIKDEYASNMFTNKVLIGDKYKHILNTPYFHKQLYNDFVKTQSQEKYVGSAYILLNSLPFKDLDDTIIYDDSWDGQNPGTTTTISTVLREIGATHFIPYHMMLKWGSIYHRYKKVINGEPDIIDNVTNAIDGNLYFDNNTYSTFETIDGKTVTRSNQSDIGFHPYYETVFHQIANGFGFLDIDSQVTSYSDNVSNGTIKLKNSIATGANTWTSIIDESKFDANDQRYTLLPSNGFNHVDGENFTLAEQENFRIIWDVGTDYTVGEDFIDYTDYEFPEYKEYFKTVENEFSLSTNYKKVVDLIATFKPDILDQFELAFLNFSSQKLNEASTYQPYDMTYSKFQDLLKEIVSVKKENNDPIDDEGFFTKIKEKQLTKLTDITSEIKSNNNLIRLSLSNPRETNDYLFGGFTNVGVENFSVNPYNASQLTAENQKYIELYLGEDMDGYYRDFFSVNDIELNEDNIKQFRPLIYMYAGVRADGQTPAKSEFVDYVKDNVINHSPVTIGSSTVYNPPKRLEQFLNELIGKIRSLEVPTETRTNEILRGINDDPTLKLETYNYHKSFNDKWTAGNSIGQRALIEEFLFLDRANKDIGDSVFLSLDKILRLGTKQNANINLYSAISLLVQDTGFDIRALPAYVNFYGATASNATKITPSKDVAKSLFGTYLDVDYQDASPKIILQYIGPSSKHPEMADISKKRYLFDNDGFDISDVNKNPIVISANEFSKTDFSKSNKCVAFEVSFGDQNQSIFKSVELDQSTLKNTAETFYVYDELGRSEGGASTAQVDIGLWNIYRQASYQCTVSCMGDVMIQPTMYFYLKNVPLFRGSYWITEVSHNIKPSGIETTFKGSRIPQRALPDVKDSFIVSYRPLFDRIVKDAIRKVKAEHMSTQTGSTQTVVTGTGANEIDLKVPLGKGESLIQEEGGVEPYGIPFNGMDDSKYIAKIEYEGQEWLRTTVIEMESRDYKIPSDQSMSIASNIRGAGDIKWKDVYDPRNPTDIYETKFNLGRMEGNKANILIDEYTITEFLNPQKPGSFLRVNTVIDNQDGIYNGPVNIGPSKDGYGIAMSKTLMTKLGLLNNDVVYFRLRK